MSVKVSINQDECTGCGLCYNDECPDIFEEGEGGNSQLKAPFRKGSNYVGEIPDDKKGCAQNAADACPVSAISLG
ncbi:MAG: ferredoxin [Methanomassiliicoccales archaeon]